MEQLRQKIIESLKTIYDPEIPVNIWDLGLIYDIQIKDDLVNIRMTFTSPTCPMMEELLEQVKEHINTVSEHRIVNIELVWEPSWDLSRMSDSAKLELDLLNQGL